MSSFFSKVPSRWGFGSTGTDNGTGDAKDNDGVAVDSMVEHAAGDNGKKRKKAGKEERRGRKKGRPNNSTIARQQQQQHLQQQQQQQQFAAAGPNLDDPVLGDESSMYDVDFAVKNIVGGTLDHHGHPQQPQPQQQHPSSGVVAGPVNATAAAQQQQQQQLKAAAAAAMAAAKNNKHTTTTIDENDISAFLGSAEAADSHHWQSYLNMPGTATATATSSSAAAASHAAHPEDYHNLFAAVGGTPMDQQQSIANMAAAAAAASKNKQPKKGQQKQQRRGKKNAAPSEDDAVDPALEHLSNEDRRRADEAGADTDPTLVKAMMEASEIARSLQQAHEHSNNNNNNNNDNNDNSSNNNSTGFVDKTRYERVLQQQQQQRVRERAAAPRHTNDVTTNQHQHPQHHHHARDANVPFGPHPQQHPGPAAAAAAASLDLLQQQQQQQPAYHPVAHHHHPHSQPQLAPQTQPLQRHPRQTPPHVAAAATLPHHAVVAPKPTPAGARDEFDKNGWAGDGSERGGSFTKEENDKLQQFMESYMKMHNLNKRQLCERVWASERKKDNFWDSVSKVLHDRSRASVYKHVRRAYHVFHVRGKWAPEEDEELRRLVETKGAQWKQIGQELGRMPEDCRDRWRNYVKCGNKRAQNKWTLQEEEKLREVVNELMAADPNADVNWTVVSEKMDGVRSRIQCRYKWNKISKKPPPNKVNLMLPGDKLAALEHLKNYSSEQEVNWDQIAYAEGRSIWSNKDFLAMFKRMKDQIPDGAKMSFSEQVNFLYNELNSLPDNRRRERYSDGSQMDVVSVAAAASSATPSATNRPIKEEKQSDELLQYNNNQDGYIESWNLKT